VEGVGAGAAQQARGAAWAGRGAGAAGADAGAGAAGGRACACLDDGPCPELSYSPRPPPLSNQGVEYFKTEAARLERMISSGSVAAAKLEEMTKKASVLAAFNGDEDEKDEE
jgi:hypothetical protein